MNQVNLREYVIHEEALADPIVSNQDSTEKASDPHR